MLEPKLSIIIPCYLKSFELLDLTRNAVYSFREAELPNYELILVDDGGEVGSGYLRDEADTYIRHKTNQGFIKSVNDGLRLARGRYIAVANNDIRVAPNLFAIAKDALADESVFSVHPRMCFYDEPLVYGDKTYIEGRERWCQSSFFAMRNQNYYFPEWFEGTGGAYEDWFFWSQIRKDGWKTAYTTKTCFQHKDSSTTQIIGEGSKGHGFNKEFFKNEFGDYPEDYYIKLYPDQMQMDWRGEFTKL